jgi:hypothetical protein
MYSPNDIFFHQMEIFCAFWRIWLHAGRALVTCDETWVHQFEPENKTQSMQWRYVKSPPPRKFSFAFGQESNGYSFPGYIRCATHGLFASGANC